MNIIVIGGGAAGLMAAGTAAEQGANVTLFETNEKVGRKLFITGKGRCNVCNDCDAQEVLRNVPVNPRFLYSALGAFSPADVKAFFEEKGVALKTERGNRVFPVSDRSFDITSALERELKRLHVKLVRDRALDILLKDGHTAAVKGEKGDYPASSVILATGGVSYPATGSTGDGFRMAESLGHTVTPLRGSLVPLRAYDCAPLQGLSLRNVALTVYENNKKIHSDFGEMLFTHFGVSGPLILSASAHMRHFDKKQYRLEIDLKPALDEQMLDKRLLSDFEKRANSDYRNVLGALLPQKMIDTFVDRSGIPPHEKVHDITRAQRETIRTLLKRWTVDVAAPMPVENAIITSGGVKVGEIDPKTMASKKVEGLYFAGEMIDVDAYTGGYNLADEYFNITHPYGTWKDTGIRLAGDAVASLTVTFLQMWNATAEADHEFQTYFPQLDYRAADTGFVQPYADGPLTDGYFAEDVYLNLIKSAKHFFYAATPYLIISDDMTRELCLAAERGVDVRIVTPGIPDKKLVYQTTRSYYAPLVRRGVRIYEYTPGFIHQKQTLCDGETATVGTINFDYRSLYHHFENGVLLHGCGALGAIGEDFEQIFEVSREVTEQYKGKRSMGLRIIQCILRLFAPLL